VSIGVIIWKKNKILLHDTRSYESIIYVVLIHFSLSTKNFREAKLEHADNFYFYT
jgi:hypothetical protein